MFVSCEEVFGREKTEGETEGRIDPNRTCASRRQRAPKIFPDFKVVWDFGVVWSFVTSVE